MRDVSRFSLGSVLATGSRHFARNLSVILPISLLAFAPAFLVIAIPVNDALRFDLGPVSVEFRYPEMTTLVCGVWLQAGLSFGAIRHLEGDEWDYGDILIGSIRSLLRCAPVAMAGVAVVVVGLLAFVLPGVVLATMLWVAVPSAAIERHGLVRALTRSYELTRDYRLRILGLLLIFVAIGASVEFAISLVLFPLVPEGLLSLGTAKQVGAVFIWGLFGSIAVVCYYDLRTLKEGAANRVIAQAFE